MALTGIPRQQYSKTKIMSFEGLLRSTPVQMARRPWKQRSAKLNQALQKPRERKSFDAQSTVGF